MINFKDRQEARRDFSVFASLIEFPGSLITGIILPANGRFAMSSDSVFSQNEKMIDIDGRVLFGNVGAANKLHQIDFIERGRTVKKATGAVGNIKLFVSNGLGQYKLIGQ